MLPEAFIKRMQALLGDATEEFLAALKEEPVRALRINRIKAMDAEAERLCPFPITPLAYDPDGYIFNETHIGQTPLHHSGGIYVQDPGAMSAVAALPLKKGMRVADFCAAPGGKSAQIAAAISEEGMLFCNEFIPSRAKILVGNLERLGVRSAIVTSTDTASYKKWFSAYFDAVVVDAPCSGEGMFRKNETAIEEWSEENVRRCAERQREILENAATTVKDGGYLLYSTCTFSKEENEENVVWFLRTHPDYTLVKTKDEILPYTAAGVFLPDAEDIPLHYCRRFYPQISKGEGQFVALMQRKTSDLPTILYKDASEPLKKDEAKVAEDFIKSHLNLPKGLCIRRVGDRISILKEGEAIPPRSVFLSGVCLGEIAKGRLIPHHQLFSALGECFFTKIPLSDAEAARYLRGEELAASEGQGYAAVFYNGISLGGAKVANGRLKNHYPKGLRNP